VVLKEMLNESEVAYLRDSCTNAWREVKGKDAEFSNDRTWLQNALLPNIHHFSKAVYEYYFYGPLIDIAGQLIGPNIKGVTSQLTFKTQGNTQNFEWHHDNLYGHLTPYNSLSCLTALDQVTKDNGCIRLVPRSHLKGQLEHGLTRELKMKHVAVKLDVKEEGMPILMDAGDVLIMHCHCLHRSMGNFTSRDRRILFLRYSDADAVEVYNENKPRLGRLLRGTTQFEEVAQYEQELQCPLE
jgi:ectoine hydroxylase-related dioxygenase (phytanoyl-CoA dioxygenase family)